MQAAGTCWVGSLRSRCRHRVQKVYWGVAAITEKETKWDWAGGMPVEANLDQPGGRRRVPVREKVSHGLGAAQEERDPN